MVSDVRRVMQYSLAEWTLFNNALSGLNQIESDAFTLRRVVHYKRLNAHRPALRFIMIKPLLN